MRIPGFGKGGMGRFVLIYSLANAAVKLTPMILLPVLTRRFSPGEYGIMTAFMAVLSMVDIAVLMGGVDAIMRAYCDREQDPARFGRFVFNTGLVNVAAAVLIGILFLLGGSALSVSLGIPQPWLSLIPASAFLLVFFSYFQKLAAFEKKPMRYSFFSGLFMAGDLAATLFFVFFLSWPWYGRAAGILVTRVVSAVGSFWYFRRRGFLSAVVDWRVLRESVSYGFPVFIHSMGFVALSSMDRLFLTAQEGPEATGIYGVAASLVGITNILITAFGLTWIPMLFERLKKRGESDKAFIVRATYKVSAAMTLGMTVFALTAPLILRVMAGQGYQGAAVHLNWLCAAALFNGLYVAVSGYIFYFKKVTMLAGISVVMAALGGFLYKQLIHMNGPVGAAQAQCAVFFMRFLVVAMVGNAICPMPWLQGIKRGRIA